MVMVLTTAFGLASRVVMSRMIGPEGVGVYSLVILVPSLALVFGNLGINTSNIYFAGNCKFELSDLVGTVFISTSALGILLMAIVGGWAFVAYHTIFQDAPKVLAAFAILSIPFFYYLTNVMSLIQGRNQIGQYNLISLASVIVAFALLMSFLVLGHMGLYGAVLAWFLSTLFNALFSLSRLRILTPIPLRFKWTIFNSLLTYGVNAYVANLAGFLVRRVDVLIVANMLGVTVLGHYSIAFTISELLWYVASSATISLTPYIAAADRTDSKHVTNAVVRSTLWGTGVLCLCVPLLDRFAIRLVFGSAFSPSIDPLRWLLPGILFGAVEKILAADLVGRGRPDIMMASAILALAVNVILNLVLIPIMGISGASLASSLAYGVAAIFTLTRYLRLTHSNWKDALVLRLSDIIYFKNFAAHIINKKLS